MIALLTATDLTRTADGKTLLDGASLSIDAGDRVALVGPSGSGKTVLLRAISMLDPIDQGTVAWQESAIQDSDVPPFRGRVIYLHQQPALPEGTVESMLRGPFELTTHRQKPYSSKNAIEILTALGKSDTFLQQPTIDLSGGESQVAALVRAVVLKPNILLLDEPTSALDADATQRVEAFLTDWVAAADNRALVWVTHDPQQAQRISNRTLHIAAGRIEAV